MLIYVHFYQILLLNYLYVYIDYTYCTDKLYISCTAYS